MNDVIFNVGSSDTGSAALSSILNGALSYDATKHLIINLTDAGRYTLPRRYDLHCHLTINGFVAADGTKSEIYFTNAAFGPTETTSWGDGFIQVQGPVAGYPRPQLSASISNVKFTLENTVFNKTNYFTELLLIKLWGCCRVDVRNVDSYLANGAITNLDIRDSSNIIVENCYFENKNAVKLSSGALNAAGGCLWIRGGCRNVRILGNDFFKDGNDEVIGIWGGNDAKEYPMEDIVIADNVITYGKLGATVGTNDVLISFYSVQDFAKVKAQNWRNLTFCRNKVICNGLVRRIVWMRSRYCDDVENVSFNDNLFVHSSYKSTASDSFVEDFEIVRVLLPQGGTQMPEGVVRRIKVNGNEIVASEKIVNSMRHRVLIARNVEVEFSGNKVDSTEQATTLIVNNETVVYKGAIIASPGGYTCRITMRDNTLVGAYQLVGCIGDSGKDSKLIECEIYGNSTTRSSMCYMAQAKGTNLYVKGNVFDDTGYFALVQEFGQEGKLLVSDNVFIRSEDATNGGVLLAEYRGTPVNPSYVTVTGNTFIGYPEGVLSSVGTLGQRNLVKNNLTKAY